MTAHAIESPAASERSLLRVALKLDAVVTGANGAAYLALAGPLSDLLGLEAALLRAVGAFLLVFAAASGSPGTRGAVQAIIVANVVWAAGSIVAAIAGWGSPETVGTVWMVLQAVVVAGFAELQLTGLRRERCSASVMAMSEVVGRPRVGPMLRDWRQRRRMSQLDLALEAGISTRHLSFVETGRSRPSAEMVVLLAEHLDVPLRDRNQLLLAAGYAPAYGQRDFDDPALEPVRAAIDAVLAGHEPYPARRRRPPLGDGRREPRDRPADRGVGAAPARAAGERAAARRCTPRGWRRGSRTWASGGRTCSTGWAARRWRRGDPALAALHAELASYPRGEAGAVPDLVAGEIAVPLRLRAGRRASSRSSPPSPRSGRRSTSRCRSCRSRRSIPADAATAAYVRGWEG